ncbi:MAG: LuxR C-terminal-related transcriptional regulator [Rhizobiaceae bacterium]
MEIDYDTANGCQALDLIENSGGWRLALLGKMELFPIAEAMLKPDHLLTHPNAYLGVSFYLARRNRVIEARDLFSDLRAAFNSGKIDGADNLAVELPIVDVHIRYYEDSSMGQAELDELQVILDRVPASDPLSRALAMNYLCNVAMHLGDFNFSQGYAENAIRAYLDGGADFGALHLHAHLGQIRLARGDLVGADREYRVMAKSLQKIKPDKKELLAICKSLRSEAAYEMNEIAKSEALLKSALRIVEDHGAWLDVLAAGYRVSTRLAMHHDGLPGALSALAHAEAIATKREMPRLHRLLQLEKIRALTLSNELDAAGEEIRRAGFDNFAKRVDWDIEADWAMRLGSTIVALARFLIADRRAAEALLVLNVAEDHAIHNGQMLTVAKLRVIRALALWRLRHQNDAINALVSAVRILGKQPFRRFIIDEGSNLQEIVQAALDGDNIEARSNRLVRHRFRELNHLWTVQHEKPKTGNNPGVPSHSDHERSYAGRRQYLELLAVGKSNKEISRALGVSQNTVKYHLKIIFKELGVNNRVRAANRARDLGIF